MIHESQHNHMLNTLFNLCSIMTNKFHKYALAHPKMVTYDVNLRQNAIDALDRAILRGENFATSDARIIIRDALENL